MMNRGGGRMRWGMLYTSRLSRMCHCGMSAIATTVMAKYLISLLGGMHQSSCVWTMWSIVRLRLVIISAIIVPLIVRTIVALIRSTVVIALGGRVAIIWVVVRLVRWWEVRVVLTIVIRVTELARVRILIWVIGRVAVLVWIEIWIFLTCRRITEVWDLARVVRSISTIATSTKNAINEPTVIRVVIPTTHHVPNHIDNPIETISIIVTVQDIVQRGASDNSKCSASSQTEHVPTNTPTLGSLLIRGGRSSNRSQRSYGLRCGWWGTVVWRWRLRSSRGLKSWCGRKR